MHENTKRGFQNIDISYIKDTIREKNIGKFQNNDDVIACLSFLIMYYGFMLIIVILKDNFYCIINIEYF